MSDFRTTPLTIRPRRSGASASGFTMVELLVVVALIAVVGLYAIPNIGKVFKVSLSSAARELAGVIKETYNSAVMTKQVYRIVYDFKEEAYWVEAGPASILMETNETKEAEARRKRFSSLKDKKPEDNPWMSAKGITRKHKSLPRGVEFEDVSTEQNRDPITEGRAYTHFFPHGMIEQTVIHLKDNSKHRSTLVILPLVGRTRVYDRFVPLEEALGELEAPRHK